MFDNWQFILSLPFLDNVHQFGNSLSLAYFHKNTVKCQIKQQVQIRKQKTVSKKIVKRLINELDVISVERSDIC